MPRKKEDLIEAIQLAAGRGIQHLSMIRAKVKTVDESNYTIIAVDSADDGEPETPVYNASLRASVIAGDLGFIAVPEVESVVLLGFAHNSEQQAVVLECSKIEKIIVTVKTSIELKLEGDDKSKLKIDENGFELKRSDSGKLMIDSEGVKLGGAAEFQVKGDTLKGWAQQVDDAINAIIQWGAGGLAGTGGTSDVGGIAPLSGAQAPQFPADALSEKHKLD